MNTNRHPKIEILFVLLMFFVLFSCSDDTAQPLYPDDDTADGGTGEDVDWQSIANEVQDATYNTFLGTEGTFVEDNQGSTRFNYWPNAHVLNTMVDGYIRTSDNAYLPRMKALLTGIKVKNGATYSNVFNDDMLWLGNACVRAYQATDDQEYLDVAEFLWNDVIESYSEVFGGGITWKKDTPMTKNAVSNAPAIILAMRLYRLTQEATYLDWATSLYEWQKQTLVDPRSGLVWDHITQENGATTIRKDWIFTYNMGTWIGASLRLYDATDDSGYMANALLTADALTESSLLVSQGILKDEGQGDGGLFKGILVRYFTELIEHPDVPPNKRESYTKFLRANALTFYEEGLKRPELMAGPNWSEQPDGATDLTTQLSGLMLLEAAAKLEANGLFE